MTDLETKNYPNIRQSFEIAGIMMLGLLLMTPISLILNKFIGEEASMFIYLILAVGIPFWIVYWIRKRKTGATTFNFEIQNKRIIPFVVIAAIALLFGIVSPISDLIPMPEIIKKAFMGLANHTGFFTFLSLVIAAPILEELIFRGIILDGLLKKYSPVTSILISTILFASIHLNPWQFVAGLFFGLFIGWVYSKTGSLSLAMIIHATVNLSGFLRNKYLGNFYSSTMNETLVESYGGVLNLVLVICGSMLVIVVCFYCLNKEFKKKGTKLRSAKTCADMGKIKRFL